MNDWNDPKELKPANLQLVMVEYYNFNKKESGVGMGPAIYIKSKDEYMSTSEGVTMYPPIRWAAIKAVNP